MRGAIPDGGSILRIGAEWIASYSEAFVKDIHELLAWGYDGAREEIANDACPENAEEEAITGLIVESMRKRLADKSTDSGFDRYQVHEDRPLQDGRQTGRRRRRIDILIQTTKTACGAECVIEAKRLCANGFPIGEYTGRDGMQRFVRAEYAADCPIACMVGYVQSHNPGRWFAHLERSVESRRAELQIRSELSPVVVTDSLPYEWTSGHERTNGRHIKLYHVLLDCCRRPGGAA
jgi:hypothetical protein